MTLPGDLGAAIAHLRGDRTQAEVAQKAGLDPTTWSLYEAGRRRPQEANLRKVLHGLGCDRLEFEAVLWEIRKRRLVQEREEDRRAGSPRFVRTARRFAEDLYGTRDDPGDDPLRGELRTLLTHITVLAEEVLIVMARARPLPPSSPKGTGEAQTGETAS